MFLTMIVTLYTSRVVLNVLGVVDYGIYNVVGGVVSMFSFFNAAMTSSTQRYLSFEIGKKDFLQTSKIFSSTLNIYLIIAFIFLIIAETIGLWFVNIKLNIPADRINALNFVYQFSILTFIIGMIRVPYNSMIIAKEKMSIYAVYSIIEVLLKLALVFLLIYVVSDKLELYSVLVLLVTSIITLMYSVYCIKNFKESKYFFFYEKELYSELVSYSGWNLFGNFASVAKGQGVNILLNIFFSTVINAAYGITLQVQNTMNVFVTNFQMAVNPQIIKNYAQDNVKQVQSLINKSSKFSFILMLLLTLPIYFNCEAILKLWLVNPPDLTVVFVKLCLLNVLIDSLSGPLMTGIQATGKIRNYQIVVGLLVFLNLPMSYLFLKIGYQAYYVWIVSIVIAVLSLFLRLYFLGKVSKFNKKEFVLEVVLKLLSILLVATTVIYLITNYIHFKNDIKGLLLNVLLIEFIAISCVYVLGINKNEKQFIAKLLLKKWS